MHGRASAVSHNGKGIFAGVPNPFSAGRYHSLVVEEATLPESLSATARTVDGVVMAIAHRRLPVIGVQFHPESILTECGYPLLANFMRIAGIGVPALMPSIDDERLPRAEPVVPIPPVPVTF